MQSKWQWSSVWSSLSLCKRMLHLNSGSYLLFGFLSGHKIKQKNAKHTKNPQKVAEKVSVHSEKRICLWLHSCNILILYFDIYDVLGKLVTRLMSKWWTMLMRLTGIYTKIWDLGSLDWTGGAESVPRKCPGDSISSPFNYRWMSYSERVLNLAFDMLLCTFSRVNEWWMAAVCQLSTSILPKLN